MAWAPAVARGSTGGTHEVRSYGRCVIPKVLRRRCSGCWQQWAKRKAVWLGGNGVDMLLLSLLHQNFDGWVGLLNRWNDWKKLQKSEYSPIFIFSSRCLSTEPCPWLSYLIGVKQTQNFALSGVLIRRNSPWDRADSLARFVLPHPTGRRGLSGLQRAPTCRLGTPSAPLLRSGGEEKNFREGQRGTDRQGGWVGGVSWFSPSRQLSTTQPLAHSPSVGWGRESEEQKGCGVGSKHKCEGLERVKEYQKLILYGIQHGVQKPKNLSKLSEVRQGHKETPSAFSERLCEVARKRTDLDPEDDSNSKLFNTPFIGQAATDIRKR
ncbi:hypothetical protein QYF61_001693 [Mycteria americana]|uniref:Core shell protein Gag P30 domain-containing protein n=1 Tax=Mycteria americana TaxID=33587 RepID=A0AAN7NVM2_MYCAM|nr:hypothetical protein QYF61_001693 [Mycteria americana]